jgi:hypothetical protein
MPRVELCLEYTGLESGDSSLSRLRSFFSQEQLTVPDPSDVPGTLIDIPMALETH